MPQRMAVHGETKTSAARHGPSSTNRTFKEASTWGVAFSGPLKTIPRRTVFLYFAQIFSFHWLPASSAPSRLTGF
jgi:hypothetical protein